MNTIRVWWKLWLREFRCIPAFCGRDVHDFIAPESTWQAIEPHIKHGSVLCYDCFCELCAEHRLPAVWELKAHT